MPKLATFLYGTHTYGLSLSEIVPTPRVIILKPGPRLTPPNVIAAT